MHNSRFEEMMATATMKNLDRAISWVLAETLMRVRGEKVLTLTVGGKPASLVASNQIHLSLHGNAWCGDLKAAASEPLPFIDDSFSLVLLEHVLQYGACREAVLDDAVRLLAPGGYLVVVGFSPLSLWLPWLAVKGVPLRYLRAPGAWKWSLSSYHVTVRQVTRVGGLLPTSPSTGSRHLGGAYVLTGCKQPPQRPTLKWTSFHASSFREWGFSGKKINHTHGLH